MNAAQVRAGLLDVHAQVVNAGLEITPDTAKACANALESLFAAVSDLPLVPIAASDVATKGIGNAYRAVSTLHDAHVMNFDGLHRAFADAFYGVTYLAN